MNYDYNPQLSLKNYGIFAVNFPRNTLTCFAHIVKTHVYSKAFSQTYYLYIT